MTIPELVDRIAKIVEARGGRWPSAVTPIIEDIVYEHATRAVSRRERIRRLLADGSWEGTQEDMARILGMRRESLARVMAGLLRERVVVRSGRYRGRYELSR